MSCNEASSRQGEGKGKRSMSGYVVALRSNSVNVLKNEVCNKTTVGALRAVVNKKNGR